MVYVPCYRCLHMSLICNLFFQSSDTEIFNILWSRLRDFRSANEQHFGSTFPHLPSCIFSLPVCSHSWKKHPIVLLLSRCGSEKSSRYHLLPDYKNTTSRDHMFSIMQVRTVDTNTSLSMDLDSSPSMNQKKRMEIKQVSFWPPQLYLMCLFTETLCLFLKLFLINI